MGEYLQIFILGVVQGISEFLPVSSSGHLALGSKLLGMRTDQSVDMAIILHGGSLLAIIIFYFHQIRALLTANGLRYTVPALIVGSIPAGIIGVWLKLSGSIDSLFDNMAVVGCGFLLTAAMLLLAFKKKDRADAEDIISIEKIPLKKAFLIGCAQAIAIIPGVSRSGSTIASGFKLKLNRQSSAAFSFLLALPAIGGALLLKIISAISDDKTIDHSLGLMGFGFMVSAISGLIALKFLVFTLKKGNFEYFAYYLLIPAILAFLSFLGII